MKNKFFKSFFIVSSFLSLAAISLSVASIFAKQQSQETKAIHNDSGTYKGTYSFTFGNDSGGATAGCSNYKATLNGMEWYLTLPYLNKNASNWHLATNTSYSGSVILRTTDYYDRVARIVLVTSTNSSKTVRVTASVGSSSSYLTASNSKTTLTYEFNNTRPCGEITIQTSNATGGYYFHSLTIYTGRDVEISGGASSIYDNETTQFTSDAPNTTWSTSDSSIATIDSDGILHPVAPGTVTVYADATDYYQSSVEVEIKDSSIPELSVSTNKEAIWVNETGAQLSYSTRNFTPDSVTYISSDSSIASVDEYGYLTPVSRGTVTITCEAYDGEDLITSSNSVDVDVKYAEYTLSGTELSLSQKSSQTVTVTPVDFDGTVIVTATSRKLTVCSVSVSGTTITINTGKVDGASTIIDVSVHDSNGHSAPDQTISVTLKKNVTLSKITALPSSEKEVYIATAVGGTYLTSAGGGTTTFSNAGIFLLGTNGTIKSKSTGYYISYKSSADAQMGSTATQWRYGFSNESYPGLLQMTSASGRFLAYNSGSLKAYAYSGLSSYTKLYAFEVLDEPESISLSKNSLSLLEGESETLSLTITNFIDTGVNVSYSTDDICEVALNETTTGYNVVVDCLNAGSTTVTFTVSGGANPHSVSLTVTVGELYTFSIDKGGVISTVNVTTQLINCINNANTYISCDNSGQSSSIDWTNVENSFSGLDSSMKENLKYGISNPIGNLVEDFLARYDYIISKYTVTLYEDFLGRIDSGNISTTHFVNLINDNLDSTFTFIVLAIAAFATIGSYVFLKVKSKRT